MRMMRLIYEVTGTRVRCQMRSEICRSTVNRILDNDLIVIIIIIIPTTIIVTINIAKILISITTIIPLIEKVRDARSRVRSKSIRTFQRKPTAQLWNTITSVLSCGKMLYQHLKSIERSAWKSVKKLKGFHLYFVTPQQ